MSYTPFGQTVLVLYDAARGGTPDTQGRLAYRASPEAAAAQSFAEGRARLLREVNRPRQAPAGVHLLSWPRRRKSLTRRWLAA